ncbi:P22 phage major capsid protein family protein [Xanthobacter sp. VTT E-85241]|uniref:P22 phage major capsid protein family protein n=1 Tax=Roseixanthobacter finlandensis TaxID=3119922 RepID=UPI00372A5BCF
MAATTTTLTGLVPTIYEAFDRVAREQVGFIPAVSKDASAERAALNQTIRSPIVGAMAAENLTVDNVAASAPDQTIAYVDMTISRARSVSFGITGEDALSVNQSLATINRDRISQALRTLTNEVEADLAALHIYASRAYGTYNATPFGTAGDFSDFAQTRRILDENGVPQSDLQMVLGGSAVANIRGKQSVLFKANEAGTDDMLRRGVIGMVEGWDIHNSGQVKTAVTAGTNNGSAATTNAGFAVGATTIALGSAGTGTIIAGDIITFAGDTNKYLVVTGDTDVSGGGSIVIAEPGLRVAIPASATVITTIAATTRNMFFHRSAIQLATRAPAMPDEGDAADDVMILTDPISGIAYEFCVYKQKRQVRYEVNLAWGVKMVMPRFAGVLIGA